MSEMISLLILIFIYDWVQCSDGSDWCKLIKPKGFYEGLGFYHRFDGFGADQYVMFNKAGQEWKVAIQSTDLTLTLIEGSVKNFEDKGVVNKFGTFALFEPTLKKPGGMSQDCSVITSEENWYQIVCSDGQQNFSFVFNSSGSTNFVILKVNAMKTTKDRAQCLIFDKDSTNKSEYFAFNPFVIEDRIECNTSQQISCKVPLFVQQIDDSIFNKIDAIVDFSLEDGLSGHIIFFNIKGQPKYCMTYEDQPLSDECKSTKNMKILFNECFFMRWYPTTIKMITKSTADIMPTKTNEERRFLNNVLVVSIVVVMIWIIIVLAVFCNRNRSSGANKNETQRPTETSVSNSTRNDQRLKEDLE